MRTNLKSLALAALVTLVGAGLASAQSAPPRQTPPSPSAQAPQDPPAAQNPSTPSDRSREASTAPVSGELTRVNPDSKTFTVKSTTGDIQFKYSDMTTITGAQKTLAGLATMSGEQVTVTYRVEGGSNMATKIEVKEKK